MEEGAAASKRALLPVLPNGPLRGHPDLDEFVVPLADVEARSGLRFFPELGEERHALPPLCAGGEAGGPSCGVGAMDGRIAGWKLFGQLKLASDCKQLSSAWADVQKAGKLDNMGLMKAEHNEKAGKMACPLTPTVKSV